MNRNRYGVSLLSRWRSRSLTELTRQVAPPTKNGHAPPLIRSRKAPLACQSLVCPDPVRFPVLSQIKPQAPLLVCRSVNSFKFQPCDHTPPGTQRLWFPTEVLGRPVSKASTGTPACTLEDMVIEFRPNPWPVSFSARTTTVSDHFRSPGFRS